MIDETRVTLRILLNLLIFKASVLRELQPDGRTARLGFAVIVVVSILAAISSGVMFANEAEKYGSAASFAIGAVTGLLQSMVHGALWTIFTARLGRHLMPDSDFDRARASSVMGITYAPNVLRIFAFLPAPIGSIFVAVAAIWHAILAFIGVRFMSLGASPGGEAPPPTNRYIHLYVVTLVFTWSLYFAIMFTGRALAGV